MEKDEIKLFYKDLPQELEFEIEKLLRAWGYRLQSEGKNLDIKQFVYRK